MPWPHAMEQNQCEHSESLVFDKARSISGGQRRLDFVVSPCQGRSGTLDSLSLERAATPLQ